jgi:TRAP-type mannitol/chloroaromatic compound transport system permease small subunit
MRPPEPETTGAADPAGVRHRSPRRGRAVAVLDALVGATTDAGRWLVLPVSLLLFAQWPLREVVQQYSREANDLAQVLFAIYGCIAITAATRGHAHLAVDALASRLSPRTRDRIARAAALVVLVPWSAFLLYAAWPLLAQSVGQWESFPETFNPGYWALKLAVGLMALLVLVQAVVAVLSPDGGPDE